MSCWNERFSSTPVCGKSGVGESSRVSCGYLLTPRVNRARGTQPTTLLGLDDPVQPHAGPRVIGSAEMHGSKTWTVPSVPSSGWASTTKGLQTDSGYIKTLYTTPWVHRQLNQPPRPPPPPRRSRRNVSASCHLSSRRPPSRPRGPSQAATTRCVIPRPCSSPQTTIVSIFAR